MFLMPSLIHDSLVRDVTSGVCSVGPEMSAQEVLDVAWRPKSWGHLECSASVWV